MLGQMPTYPGTYKGMRHIFNGQKKHVDKYKMPIVLFSLFLSETNKCEKKEKENALKQCLCTLD